MRIACVDLAHTKADEKQGIVKSLQFIFRTSTCNNPRALSLILESFLQITSADLRHVEPLARLILLPECLPCFAPTGVSAAELL
jgi:hypothetical protein